MEKPYVVWATPYPGWQPGNSIFPVSSHLHMILTKPDPEVVDKLLLAGAKPFHMSKLEVEEFIRHDAEHWSWKKTGHHSRNEFFDRCHFNRLYAAMVTELSVKGVLDFTQINAGVRI